MDIKEYCMALGSNSPTPGGGSASGIVLSLAGSCAEKAARFSIHDHLEKYIESFVEIREEGIKLAADDEEAFLGWKEARALPKSTDKEKYIRTQKIESYIKKCVMTPYKVAEYSLRLAEIIQDFVPYCNKWLISDIMVGTSLAFATFESALYNIDINIPYLKDKKLLEELDLFTNDNKKYFEKLKKNIIKLCLERLK